MTYSRQFVWWNKQLILCDWLVWLLKKVLVDCLNFQFFYWDCDYSYWWNDIYKNQWTKFALLILLLVWSVSGVSCISGHVLCSAGMTGRWRPQLIVWLDYKGMHGHRNWGSGHWGLVLPQILPLCCTWTKGASPNYFFQINITMTLSWNLPCHLLTFSLFPFLSSPSQKRNVFLARRWSYGGLFNPHSLRQWLFLHYKTNNVAYCHTCVTGFKQGKMRADPAFVSVCMQIIILCFCSFWQDTVRSHLSELQLSEHDGYPNAFSKAAPTISGYFHRVSGLALPVVWLASFPGPVRKSIVWQLKRHRITSTGKAGFATKVKATTGYR